LGALHADDSEASSLSSIQHKFATDTHRRRFLKVALASLGVSALANEALAARIDPIVAARVGLARVGDRIAHHDVVAVADFAQPSWVPRFHLVDLAGGKVETLLVAHGRGSDPEHTGWLRSFSNRPGSDATSQGHYVTGPYYVGQHGRAMRLQGLDATNSNAEERAIVVHAAWYASPNIVRDHGKLGCSEGCFALSPSAAPRVLDRLGPGRLLVAAQL
jgi:hypothetical protein